ncbi:hypothetical protein HNY73_013491 [Argiope bruennichi]|uniref:Uncharacterized protein n=1 Tax=Argiope bruennichi TaxID=94029 RepID=A0A8T0F474_ARGBR|nr:hypothetical protein HNY73_013491 [Argiope bruennichi]
MNLITRRIDWNCIRAMWSDFNWETVEAALGIMTVVRAIGGSLLARNCAVFSVLIKANIADKDEMAQIDLID